MSKLIRAGLVRAWKSKTFLVCVAVMAVWCGIMCYLYIASEEHAIEPLYFQALFGLGVVQAIFGSLFTGDEHSDGTVRNKLIAGHSRRNIFLSNFLVNVIVGISLAAISYTLVFGMGILLGGVYQMGISNMLLFLVISLLGIAVCAGIYNCIGMLNVHKSHTAIICLLLCFGMFFVVFPLYTQLSQPPTFFDLSEIENEIVEIKNINYIDGLRRTVYQFIIDILPIGQGAQLMGMGNPEVVPISETRMLFSSLFLIVTVNAAGILCFSRKDIK